MKRLAFALVLASTTASCAVGVGVPSTTVQHVQAPSGGAFAEVRTLGTVDGKMHYVVILGAPSEPQVSAAGQKTPIAVIFGYDSEKDSAVRVRWDDDTHLVISYRRQPNGSEFIRLREHEGIRIDFQEGGDR